MLGSLSTITSSNKSLMKSHTACIPSSYGLVLASISQKCEEILSTNFVTFSLISLSSSSRLCDRLSLDTVTFFCSTYLGIKKSEPNYSSPIMLLKKRYSWRGKYALYIT
ncbi:hypothetical protein ACTFIW_000920 [Dictyostelium discoideum]